MEQHWISRAIYRKPLWLGLLVFSVGIEPVQAQSQNVEARLRHLVRTTSTELQQVKAQLASEQAARAAFEKQLERLKADLAAERVRGQRLSASNAETRREAQTSLEKAGAQTAQYRSAHQELLQTAHASEAERARLASELAANGDALKQCEAKNAQLYALGQEILLAYEHLDVATVLAARQPFADRSRVKLDEIAQQYGDRLYQGKVDARTNGAEGSVAGKPASTP